MTILQVDPATFEQQRLVNQLFRSRTLALAQRHDVHVKRVASLVFGESQQLIGWIGAGRQNENDRRVRLTLIEQIVKAGNADIEELGAECFSNEAFYGVAQRISAKHFDQDQALKFGQRHET